MSELDGELNEESLKSFLENFGKPLVSDYTEVNELQISILTDKFSGAYNGHLQQGPESSCFSPSSGRYE